MTKKQTLAQRGEPRPSMPEGVRELYDTVRIRDVALVQCEARVYAPPPKTLYLEMGRKAEGLRTASPPELKATIEFRLVGRSSEEPDASEVFSMKAMFEARYLLPEDANPSEEAIAFFACTNGVFNLWPYWREFVQSMASRMGLPRLTVPTYRIEEAFTGPGTVERRTRRRRTASRSARSR